MRLILEVLWYSSIPKRQRRNHWNLGMDQHILGLVMLVTNVLRSSEMSQQHLCHVQVHCVDDEVVITDHADAMDMMDLIHPGLQYKTFQIHEIGSPGVTWSCW